MLAGSCRYVVMVVATGRFTAEVDVNCGRGEVCELSRVSLLKLLEGGRVSEQACTYEGGPGRGAEAGPGRGEAGPGTGTEARWRPDVGVPGHNPWNSWLREAAARWIFPLPYDAVGYASPQASQWGLLYSLGGPPCGTALRYVVSNSLFN